jgi:chorismatase
VTTHSQTSDSQLALNTRYLKGASANEEKPFVLGVMNLTASAPPLSSSGPIPHCHVRFGNLGNPEISELWSAGEPVTYHARGPLTLAKNGQVMMGVISFPDTQTELELQTQTTYRRILDCCETEDYPHLFRIWNFIPHINEPDAFGMERYRAFCKGRALAFFDDRHCKEQFLPAGTGVGSRGGPVTICFLASRNERPINLENSRQVPAYHYPTCYGPKSPSFARGTYLRLKAGEVIYVSGTSSIVGHETLFPGDVDKQCRTSLENIEFLLSRENLSGYGIQGRTGLASLDHVKVYIRHQEDAEAVKKICGRAFSPRSRVLYLGADICRSDLLVEIEGCALLESA